MEYTQLDKSEQIAAVRARILELERQHLSLSLQVRAPDMNAAPNQEQNQSQLLRLETSIKSLREQETSILSENG